MTPRDRPAAHDPAAPAAGDARLDRLARNLAVHGPLWRGDLPAGPRGAVPATLTLLHPGRGDPWPRVRICVRWGGARDPFLLAAAAADLPEAWYVDPRQSWTERYAALRRGRYRRRDLLLPGEAIALAPAGPPVTPWPP